MSHPDPTKDYTKNVFDATQEAVIEINKIKDSDEHSQAHWELAEELGALFVNQIKHIAMLAELNKKEKQAFLKKCLDPMIEIYNAEDKS